MANLLPAMEVGGNFTIDDPLPEEDFEAENLLIAELMEHRQLQQTIIEGQQTTIDTLQRTIESLALEVNQLRQKTPGKTPLTLPLPPKPPAHPKPDISKPDSKKRKTKTQPNNQSIPLFNSFSALTPTDPNTTANSDFPPPPPTNNDPSAPIPTKTPSRRPPSPLPTTLTVAPTTFSTTPPAPKPTDQIPPIILHDKDLWVPLSNTLTSQNISYSRATNTREGIRITPSTVNDYRRLNSLLRTQSHSFHSFQLPSEKTIKVVFRGVPQSISPDQILADLTYQKYIPLSVTRLNGRNNRPAPLVLVQVEAKYKSIFNLTTLCGLDITVEAKKIPTAPLQCHRCQRFGHTQPNCHAQYKCMKCAEPHSTHLCPKPNTTPAVCANCHSTHISTHHSCPENPINRKKSYSSTLKPSSSTMPTTPIPTPQPLSKTAAPSTNSFASLTFPLFEALLSTNPTPERVAAFTQQLFILKQTMSL